MIKVRKATLHDIDPVFMLWENIDEFVVTDDVVTFRPKEILKNCVGSELSVFIVAEDVSKVIWFLIVNYNPTFKKSIIENIFVSESYRQQWVGWKMLWLAQDYLMEKWCEYTCTLVEETDEKALRFYQANKFNKGKIFVWLDQVWSKQFCRTD